MLHYRYVNSNISDDVTFTVPAGFIWRLKNVTCQVVGTSTATSGVSFYTIRGNGIELSFFGVVSTDTDTTVLNAIDFITGFNETLYGKGLQLQGGDELKIGSITNNGSIAVSMEWEESAE